MRVDCRAGGEVNPDRSGHSDNKGPDIKKAYLNVSNLTALDDDQYGTFTTVFTCFSPLPQYWCRHAFPTGG